MSFLASCQVFLWKLYRNCGTVLDPKKDYLVWVLIKAKFPPNKKSQNHPKKSQIGSYNAFKKYIYPCWSSPPLQRWLAVVVVSWSPPLFKPISQAPTTAVCSRVQGNNSRLTSGIFRESFIINRIDGSLEIFNLMMIFFFLILFIAQKSQKYKIITLRLFSKTNKTLCKFYMMR